MGAGFPLVLTFVKFHGLIFCEFVLRDYIFGMIIKIMEVL